MNTNTPVDIKNLLNELKASALDLNLPDDKCWEATEGDFSLLLQYVTACPDAFYESSRYNHAILKLAYQGQAVPLDWLDDPNAAQKLKEKLEAEIRSDR